MQLHTHSTGSSARHRVVSPTRADRLRAAKRASSEAAGLEPAASAIEGGHVECDADEDGADERGAGEDGAEPKRGGVGNEVK